MLSTIAMLVVAQAQAAPVPPQEFRAAWVATVDNIDWPSKRGLPVDVQQYELKAIVERAASLNLNALIFQVRPSADALYPSKLEPWSEYLTGLNGKAPEPLWDPLEFLVKEAHAVGIEVHCWFNPYRAWHPAAKAPAHPTHVSKANPEWVRDYGTFKWMDPSEPGVQQRSLDVMLDVTRRYDIDGVHIDDYFYPYQVTDAAGNKVDFPDKKNWDAYVSSGGRLNKGDWRRKQVDDFIERLYAGIKKEKAWVKFGISPFGIYRPNVPEGIRAGVDQYADLYADALKWFREGWVDYFTPQLYWRITQTPQSYPVLLNWWAQQNPKGRHLWPGNFTGQISGANWPAQEVLDQIAITRGTRGASGNVHFSFKVFANNAKGINEALTTGLYAERALVPASPWLDPKAPGAPKLEVRTRATGDRSAVLTPPEDADLRFAGLMVQREGKWTITALVDAKAPVFALPKPRPGEPPVQSMVGFVVDRAGNVSPMSNAVPGP